MENPYTPPTSELEDAPPSGSSQGALLPWEALPRPGGAMGATLRLLLGNLSAAGEGLRATPNLGRAILWNALLGLLPAMLLGLLGLLHPIHAFWQSWLGIPVQPAPEGPVLVFGIIGVVFMAPIGVAISLALLGVINHACLWLMRGTREGLGLLLTFRAVLYTTGAITLVVTLPLSLLQYLPGRAGEVVQYLVLGVYLGTNSYQGLVLAKAHRTEGWRGVVAVWIPVALFTFCCGGAVLALWHFGPEEFRQGILQAMRGGR